MPVTRRDFLRYGAVATAAALLPRGVRAALGAQTGRPPNFIIIFTDDQGYADLGCFGATDLATPNLDRMAAEGMKFTDFYVAGPVCTPSRAALLTGRYPLRSGLGNVLFPNNRNGLEADEAIIPELLKARGYATMCVGKWHLGHTPEHLPTRHGFDHYFGVPYSNDMSTETPDGGKGLVLMRDEQTIEHATDQTRLTERYTDEAVKFIRASKDQPFFLYLAHNMPHTPLNPGRQFAGKSKRGTYGDAIEELDWSTGEILKTLKDMGLDQDTCVIYTSDNGPAGGEDPKGGSAKPLRGAKGGTYEGGMREPCLMRYPGKIPAGKVCAELATTMDLLPTLTLLAGGTVPADRVIDGKDIWPLMAGQSAARTPHNAFFYYNRGDLMAVRSGDWKYHRELKAPTKGRGKTQTAALYNLKTDIGESKNVLAEHPEVGQRLEELCAKFDLGLQADVLKRRRSSGKAKP
jgi:arylsulfatase A-like enzyme